MNHWKEIANLKHLKEKYPIGCKIKVHWAKWGTTFEGVVKGYEMDHKIYENKAHLVLDAGDPYDVLVKEDQIIEILQEAGKEDE